LEDEVARRLVVLLAALFLVVALWIALQQRRGRYRERRIWTAYGVEFGILAAVLVPARLGTPWLLAATLAIAAASTWELLRALGAAGERPVRSLALAGGCGVVLATAWLPALPLFALPVAAGLLLATRSLAPAPARARGRAPATLFGILYPGLCLAHLVGLAQLPGGFGYVVFCYGLAEANDVFAFLIGSAFGGRRPWPELSPNKTAVGSAGGAAATLLLSVLLGFAVPALGLGERLVAGLLLAAGGQAGDLFASAIKRRAGLKDFGAVIPTQGGVLDVYDSLVLVSPLFAYYLRATVG
jgi:phosphatidate cytidylyltransferase